MLSHIIVLGLSASSALAVLPRTSPNLGRRQTLIEVPCSEQGLPACGSPTDCIPLGYDCCPAVASYSGYGCLPSQNCYVPSDGSTPGCCRKGLTCVGPGGIQTDLFLSSSTITLSATESSTSYSTTYTTSSTSSVVTGETATTSTETATTSAEVSIVTPSILPLPTTVSATPEPTSNVTETPTFTAPTAPPSAFTGAGSNLAAQQGAGVLAAALGYLIALVL
ncbi:MAG: hypothetical protein M1832_005972 [Thelocarpon impressellum]|nr:MAG: hypothetical protein M1832_005972 [Thelocarpon impressellum]